MNIETNTKYKLRLRNSDRFLSIKMDICTYEDEGFTEFLIVYVLKELNTTDCEFSTTDIDYAKLVVENNIDIFSTSEKFPMHNFNPDNIEIIKVDTTISYKVVTYDRKVN